MVKNKRYKRLSLLRKVKLIKQSKEVTTLDNELLKIKKINKNLNEISKEVNESISAQLIDSWQLKSSSRFSAKVSEQLVIINNREQFIAQEVSRAKKEISKTHIEKIEIDKRQKVANKKFLEDKENRAISLIPTITK